MIAIVLQEMKRLLHLLPNKRSSQGTGILSEIFLGPLEEELRGVSNGATGTQQLGPHDRNGAVQSHIEAENTFDGNDTCLVWALPAWYQNPTETMGSTSYTGPLGYMKRNIARRLS
jgi:hypothetical protein